MEQQTTVSTPSSGVGRWRKATASNATGSCVELGAVDGGIAMRNSRDPHGPALLYTRDEIAAFIHGVKSGEFDDLIAQP
ncbi:MAG: DUF397 domain-containing protein [Pseudonocardia sp.]